MRSIVDEDPNKKQLDEFKDAFPYALAFFIPVFMGIAIHHYFPNLEIYWVFAIVVFLANVGGHMNGSPVIFPEFYELPADMQGKPFSEIMKEVEETGEVWDTYHYEFIKNSNAEMDNND